MTPLTEAEATHVADVFSLHADFITSVARRHSVAPAAVPDIVQTVGLHVCRSLRGFRFQAGITTWLYRMTVNAARDHWRAEHRQEVTRQAVATHRPGAVRRSGPYPLATAHDEVTGVDGAALLRIRSVSPDEVTWPTQEDDVLRHERAVALRAVIAQLRPVQAEALRDEIEGRPVQRCRKSTHHRARKRLGALVATDPHFA